MLNHCYIHSLLIFNVFFFLVPISFLHAMPEHDTFSEKNIQIIQGIPTKNRNFLLEKRRTPIFIFERHYDVEPKDTVKRLLSLLAEYGYNTLCFEAPQNITEKEIVFSQNTNVEDDQKIYDQATQYLRRAGVSHDALWEIGFSKLVPLMRMYVSSQRYLKVAEKIKHLPAAIMVKEVLNNALCHSFRIKGVDIDATDFETLMAPNPSDRMCVIEKKETQRIDTMVSNIEKLYQKDEGVIFICGALHAHNLIKKFEEDNAIKNILYYFPHSDKNYDESIDEVKEFHSNDTLKNHTFCLRNEHDRSSLAQRIMNDVITHNSGYTREINGGTASSILLSNLFKKNFRAFSRPGYYVDALVEIKPGDDLMPMIKKLQATNISIEKLELPDTAYIVVPAINTEKVACAISSL